MSDTVLPNVSTAESYSQIRQFYAGQVLVTRPGERVPVAAPSCFVRDVLIREGGRLPTKSRKISPDWVV